MAKGSNRDTSENGKHVFLYETTTHPSCTPAPARVTSALRRDESAPAGVRSTDRDLNIETFRGGPYVFQQSTCKTPSSNSPSRQYISGTLWCISASKRTPLAAGA
jgi:hypothetical protein